MSLQLPMMTKRTKTLSFHPSEEFTITAHVMSTRAWQVTRSVSITTTVTAVAVCRSFTETEKCALETVSREKR